MKAAYVRAMDLIHRLCLWISGFCIVVITIIVPWGVFVRYVLSDPAHWPGWLAGPLGFLRANLGYDSSWPEPMAILLMIVFGLLSAAVCYRENLHIAVMALPDSLPPRGRIALGWLAEFGMIVANVVMVVWGIALVERTWFQTIAEFPTLSTGITYLPIPIGGAIVTLFIVERLWTGKLFAQVAAGTMSSAKAE
jgi:TRAP-type C4-dicarboxylate transport system permease small subunit